MIREQMSRDCDYDMDLFVQMLRKEPVIREESTDQERLTLLTKGSPRRSTKVKKIRSSSPHESSTAREPRRE